MKIKKGTVFLIIFALFTISIGYLLNTLIQGNKPSFVVGTSGDKSILDNVPPPEQIVQSAFVKVAEKVKPSVVNISTVHVIKGRRSFGFQPFGEDPFFRDFFENFFGQIPRSDLKQSSLGSGVIIDKKGYILTNFHVIKDADQIAVKLSDKHELKGKVVGTDPKTDLAVIKIDSREDLLTATFGDSDKLKVGEWAIAIGNPFGLDQTVTVGVISATGRAEVGVAAYENFIQTDASINPGNSGGPLLNIKGEVIGINTAIVSSGQGIGFAIPVNMAKGIVNQLVSKGKVSRGWLGVAIQPLTQQLAESFGLKDVQGALISSVNPGGPAEKTGLQQGDIILKYDNIKVSDYRHLRRLVAETEADKTVNLTIWRNKKEINLQAKITEMPDEEKILRR